MVANDPNRLLYAAQAIAAVYGDRWADLDGAARAHYTKEAVAVVTALTRYDKEVHARKVYEGIQRARKEGRHRRNPGRQRIDAAAEQKARELLMAKATSRTVREVTGLGNSTITRYRAEIEKANAHPGPATPE